MDTVRADRLECYGYTKKTAPNVCRLAAEGALFTRAFSQSSWTLPAHASILSGRYPNEHGAVTSRARMGDDQPRLARILRREGYATGAIISARLLDPNFGLRRGFDTFDFSAVERGIHSSFAASVSDHAISWLEENTSPFFLWLHYYDPHHAFLAHDGTDDARPEIADDALEYPYWNERPAPDFDYYRAHEEVFAVRYDGELRFTDTHIGRVLDHLRDTGRIDETIIYVTADHGEAFATHELTGHDNVLYDELIHVPLIVRAPGDTAPRIVDTVQETRDIFHTTLELLGVQSPWASGYNLLSDTREYAFTEVESRNEHKRAAIVGERWKLVYTLDNTVELYDRSADPSETENVAEDNPALVKELLTRLTNEMNIVILDEEAVDQLRALGYVN